MRIVLSLATLGLLSSFLSACETPATQQAKVVYSPAVYDGTANAILPNVDSLDACIAAVRENSTPEARTKLTFEKDPLEDKMPEEIVKKVQEQRKTRLGGCAASNGDYHFITKDGVEKYGGPAIYTKN
jgi:hypothetical protein